MAKRILRCPTRTPGDVALGELGLTELRYRRDQLRLGFWNKLLSYDNDTVIRRVYNESRRRVEYDGNTKVWSAYTKHLLGEYGMSDDWQNNELTQREKDG